MILGPDANLQVPPNLSAMDYQIYLDAGINDWGGVSPLTPDFVNPEAPWPGLEKMRGLVNEMGFTLRERLPVYPEFIDEEFIEPGLLERVENFADQSGYVPLEETSDESH